MARKQKGRPLNGWINLDKPMGMTSTEALARVRRALDAQKAGHGGTLDPLATGILPIALGEATKTVSFCQDHLKAYSFTIRWGEERSTDDAEGEVIASSDVRPASRQDVHAALPAFTGEIQQTPPKFSAIKVQGERAYDLARAGEEVELQARTVYIEKLDLLDFSEASAKFLCVCGKGTYMRSLARDIARALGTVGYIADLRREAVGPFTTATAISLEDLEQNGDSALLPVETVLDDIPALALNEREAARLKSGQMLSFVAKPDAERLARAGLALDIPATALAVHDGKPIALVDVDGVEIRPVRVLNL